MEEVSRRNFNRASLSVSFARIRPARAQTRRVAPLKVLPAAPDSDSPSPNGSLRRIAARSFSHGPTPAVRYSPQLCLRNLLTLRLPINPGFNSHSLHSNWAILV